MSAPIFQTDPCPICGVAAGLRFLHERFTPDCERCRAEKVPCALIECVGCGAIVPSQR
jgi:hypothetical protein